MKNENYVLPSLHQEAKTNRENSEFLKIIEDKNFSSVYQPIVSLSDAQVFGYEALTRGPIHSSFHAPLKLFQYAEKTGTLYYLEQITRERAVQNAIINREQQMLFINLSAQIIYHADFIPGKTLEILYEYGLNPKNVVFEITERSSLEDFDSAKQILQHYRQQGYKIAIDDAGAGYSSLQAIAELQPDFIKIDRSLIHNIHQDKVKEYIVETFVTFANKMNIHLVAEGIEKMDELQKVAKLGVHYGQGFLLGKPSDAIVEVDKDVMLSIEQQGKQDAAWVIGDLVTSIQQFDHRTLISEVYDYFKKFDQAYGAAIVKDRVPVGLIMREKLYRQLAGQYGYSLFWNREINTIMDKNPLIVDEHRSVEDVSQLATSREFNHLNDFVLITKRKTLLGATSIRAILEYITQEKMETARVSNPLTGLPGNIQIQRVINNRLVGHESFSVIYADLNYFKWFNDQFGFQKGDELLQYTADILQHCLSVCGTPQDFLGHIGGDDFIAVTVSENPQQLCEEMIRRFQQSVSLFWEEEKFDYVLDREGNHIESDGVTISLSLIICDQLTNTSIDQISKAAAKLKKLAKSLPGNGFVGQKLSELL